MVLITHCGGNTDKINEILVAAQRRFGMYGFEKTSVSEIAADLHMSKASIYYYFADKGKLFGAVIEKEHSEFIESVEQECETLIDASDMLRAYVNINIEFFRKLLNLSRVKHSDIMENRYAQEQMVELRQKELVIIEKTLTKGNEQGTFNVENSFEMAHLFLDLLKGLRKMTIGRKDVFYLNDEEYNDLVKRVRDFTEIFIKGISI
ncbi:TetR/AcrR family transcriptional regulator [Acetobacteroides hydrogenigenes]|uniref:TetR/AcrR family transcriptional repressor of mexJK operon n=1 Tax=Acetobacteroides hydrogenigenes TaxID=979970 RepID=A0A4R2EX72_9BACT|nr:TetR/AcrR family transcriptional regulator [Acetobacteroides hydrogenigenes]TCN73308.1 TetR/AcrR family transcriptional repressor of mexJK operon [Acetobacteroides hydrogenigenes]